MTLDFPPELVGQEVRLSAPGAEEYLIGPVPPGGKLDANVPPKFYHVSYRKGPTHAWYGDPVTVKLDLRAR